MARKKPLDDVLFAKFAVERKMQATGAELRDALAKTPAGSVERAKVQLTTFASGGESARIEEPFYFLYGKNISFGCGVSVGPYNYFEDYAHIEIGNFVIFSAFVSLRTAFYPLQENLRRNGVFFARGIRIEDNVLIGSHVTILPGVIIHEGAILLDGTVVSKNVPKNAIVSGNPAQILHIQHKKDYKNKEAILQTTAVYSKYPNPESNSVPVISK